jgi:diguanylate cyclase (GGDEF)-like protein
MSLLIDMAKYALMIAISDYDNFSPLPKTTNDGENLAQILHSHGEYQITRLPAKGNADRATYEMVAGKVTEEQLYDKIEQFLSKTVRGQSALIYFTGHGFTVRDRLGREKGYLATSNCQVQAKDEQIVTQKNAFPLEDLDYLIQQANLSELVLLLDCCHSGNFIETRLMRQSLKTFEHKQNYFLITACRDYETAKSIKKDHHSVFSGAIIAGLAAEKADEQGKISCDRLFDDLSRNIAGKLQTPLRMGIGETIILVKYDSALRTKKPNLEPIRDNSGEIVCPYRGLEVFTAREKEFFFGRKRLTADIRQKLQEYRFIPLIGASGTGKSSLVYAGVMSWLQEETPAWQILPTIKPGIDPLSQLRTVFRDRVPSEERELQEIIEDETRTIGEIIEALPNSAKYLLFIDQFEEVFTVCGSERERKRFIKLITEINGQTKPFFAIITTMRSDFLDRCLDYQSLYEIIQSPAVTYMPPLQSLELQDMMAKPAQRQGYRLEENLLSQLLADVGKEQGFLPLLEFALTLLWEKREESEKRLTLTAYQQLGGENLGETKTGLTQALDSYAEKVYQYRDFNRDNPQQERTEAEKELIKLIFLRLIRTGNQEKDTRQRQPKKILFNIAGEAAEGRKNLNRLIEGKNSLVNARLLVTGGDNENTIDLVHESLIEGWGRFARWREENRDLRRLSERLEDQRREWLQNPLESNLMMGGLLAQVRQQWQELRPYLLYPQESERFYQDSDAYEQKRVKELEELKKRNRELEKRQDELERLFNTDGLTNVQNRRFFQEELERQWQLMKLDKSYLSLILADIDYFRLYNDSYGHLQGNEALKLVAQALKLKLDNMPVESSVSRFGGEEFAILLPNISSSQSKQIAQSILDAIRDLKIPRIDSPVKPYLTISLGVATVSYDEFVDYSSDLINNADRALFLAKKSGRDCFFHWEDNT